MGKPEIARMITKYNTSSRNGVKIKYIVIHDVGAVSNARNNAIYFSKPVQPPVSAHYFVDDDSIYQVVEDNICGWHVGDGRGKYGITNANSIGIEMCLVAIGRIGEPTKDKTIELIKMLQEKHGIPNDRVVRHYDASRKKCPAALMANDWAAWKEFKARIDGAGGGKAKFKMNDKVTVKKSATHYQTGQPMAGFVPGSSYTVKAVKYTGESYAYLLAPINSWILETDLTASPGSGPSSDVGTSLSLKWKNERAKFTVTVPAGIRERKISPSMRSPTTRIVKKGEVVIYTRYTQNEGYIWIEYKTAQGTRYLPVRHVGGPAWGTFS
jgi:hypothetical protein